MLLLVVLKPRCLLLPRLSMMRCVPTASFCSPRAGRDREGREDASVVVYVCVCVCVCVGGWPWP